MDDHTTHPCPVAGCNVKAVPAHHVMCAGHWRLVPKTIQNMVYRSWNRGRPTSTYLSMRLIAIHEASREGVC